MEESYYKKLGALTLSVGVVLICVVLAIIFRPRPSSVSEKPTSTISPQPSPVVSSPEKEEATSKSSPTSSPESKPSVKTYTVQAGDTLYGIAQKFGVSWEAIAEANNIEDATTLRVGQKLVIPQQ